MKTIKMKNVTDMNASSKFPRWRRMMAGAWRWLIEPSSAIVEPERRIQARLLMAMLLVLMSLGLLSLTLSLLGVYSQLDESKEMVSASRWITLAAVLILAVEYGLSRTVHFPLAAVLTVGTLLVAIFVVVITSPPNAQYLFFLVIGGLIASILLSTRTTVIVFIVTFIGSMLLSAFVPGYSAANTIYAQFFIVAIGGLVVMAANLRQHYLEQIEWQTQQLVQSEARLRELAILDPLTGLYNRRYLEETLSLEILRAGRKGYPIGIIMVDVDHFKRINDTHGHAAGDAVLILVGSFLRNQIRSSDVACRYGGEEFILILPEASREITQMRAESICKNVKQIPMQYDGEPLEAVTLSLGVAGFPTHGPTIDAVLKAADAALYRAKRDGRDRTVAAD
jgi:diguanylate cyclase (GGDEF)-like protein